MQDLSNENNKAFIQGSRWHRNIQIPGVALFILVVSIILVIAFLTDILNINLVFAKGTTQIVNTRTQSNVIEFIEI